MISDQEKLAVYIQIVRLLLEVGRAAITSSSSSFRPTHAGRNVNVKPQR
jgi:hypothetical protein